MDNGTQFSVSINVWRLAGDTLNITCNFLYCNHQVHRYFLITLYFELIFCLSCYAYTQTDRQTDRHAKILLYKSVNKHNNIL